MTMRVFGDRRRAQHARAAVGRGCYTFGAVNEARARADFAVLTKRARRALRLDIGDDASAGLKALRDSVARILRYATPNYAERED